MPADQRRVKTPPRASMYKCGVCTQIYIYVVCELRRGESTYNISSSVLHIRQWNIVNYEQRETPSHFPYQLPLQLIPLPSPAIALTRQVVSCTLAVDYGLVRLVPADLSFPIPFSNSLPIKVSTLEVFSLLDVTVIWFISRRYGVLCRWSLDCQTSHYSMFR